MICPKCGFEQPDRNECVRCGVVVAKYLLALKRKEESENKFAPTEEASPDPLPIEAGAEYAFDLRDESRRLWGEINYLKIDRNLVKEELANLHKRGDELAQAIGSCVATSEMQRVAEEIEVAMDQLRVSKVNITDLKGKLDELKLVTTQHATVIQELGKVRDMLAKDLGKLMGIEEHRMNVQQISAEVETLKKDMAGVFGKTPEDKWKESYAQLKGELEILKSELKNLVKSNSAGEGPDVITAQALTDISALKDEVEILKSEVRKLLVNGPSVPIQEGESTAGLRELKDDIKVVKILLTDLIEKNSSVRSK